MTTRGSGWQAIEHITTMNITSKLVAGILIATLTGHAWADKKPVDWVKPQIDTVKPRWFYFNSACRPFGMVNLSPDTKTKGDWDAGYRYKDNTIECFSHIHCWQLAGLAVMPVTGKNDLKNYTSEFSHDGEIVSPGYHKVLLKTHGITAELTSTTRVGFHRYTYPKGETARVVIDLAKPLMECKMLDVEAMPANDNTAVEGTFTMSPTARRSKPFRVFFIAKFQAPFTAIGDWKNGKAVVDFGNVKSPVLMKVAISYTGIEGARANLTKELPHWDFDRVCKESADDWNSWLGRIRVDGGTDAQKTKFYTDVWHSLLGRRIVSDVDGRYMDNTGPSSVIRQGKLPHYNFDALWGAQWSLNVLWPLAWPEVVDGFAETMVNMYHNGGFIPRGPAGGNYTYVMIGDPASSFFAAAWHKGIRNWDAEAAYAGLRKNAFPGGIRDHAGYEHRKNANGGGMSYYVERGYVPEDIPKSEGGHRQGAAMTLEYAYQDWCLGQLAKSLGKTEDAALFEKRASNYQNIWDKQVGWMRPRRLDGSWYEPFEPVAVGFAAKGFVESTSAIYSYYVPHDLPGLATLFGGADAMAERLEDNFKKAEPLRFIAEHGKHAVAWVDYENQPSTGMAHVFSHIGKPWRSQYWVRKVQSTTFSDITPFGGYNGDEDQGQMGALSALMAIGLFDMDGGASIKPKFDITAPLFDKITIQLNPAYYPGKTFVITTKNNRPENCYIQSARLNGKPWNSYQVPHEVFTKGGTLELDLGPKPNLEWGTGVATF
jgi:predicted alpha-1,2-mannosidase